jgi:hypothetical protein
MGNISKTKPNDIAFLCLVYAYFKMHIVSKISFYLERRIVENSQKINALWNLLIE